MAGDGLGPETVLSQQSRNGGGKGDTPRMLAGSGGVVEASEQAGAFGSYPRQRPRVLRQVADRDRRLREVRARSPGPGVAGQEGSGPSGLSVEDSPASVEETLQPECGMLA